MLKTRIRNGYRQFYDVSQRSWEYVHRRVAEKRWGKLSQGLQVHHIDGDKLNNRVENLAIVHPKVHGRLHANPDVCYRCGREGHYRTECRSTTFYDGMPMRT